MEQIISKQLSNTNGLYSLKLQNHIYGCFIIMEDLAQGGVNLSGTILSTPKYSFDLDKQFSTIGVRYGFALDTHLVLETFNTEYHTTWIQYFKDIYSAKDINDVDNIEDSIIKVVQTYVKPDEAFFITALETGSLPQEWIEKVINLLYPPITPKETEKEKEKETEKEKEEEVQTTALTKATTEKPLTTRRHLAITRRSYPKIDIPPLKKKALAKTRRQPSKPITA
jgi:hypothetical protein